MSLLPLPVVVSPRPVRCRGCHRVVVVGPLTDGYGPGCARERGLLPPRRPRLPTVRVVATDADPTLFDLEDKETTMIMHPMDTTHGRGLAARQMPLDSGRYPPGQPTPLDWFAARLLDWAANHLDAQPVHCAAHGRVCCDEGCPVGSDHLRNVAAAIRAGRRPTGVPAGDR